MISQTELRRQIGLLRVLAENTTDEFALTEIALLIKQFERRLLPSGNGKTPTELAGWLWWPETPP
jgi:hypothetical protein